MKNKKTIGVITASASQSEQKQLLEGITMQAAKLGAYTAIFSNIYNSYEYFAEVEIENRIYDLITSEKLDGLILTAESFLNADVQQFIYKKILARKKVPVVVTGAEIDDFIYINNDVMTDIEDIVNHLIEVHNFSDIDFLTGVPGIDTTNARVCGYRKSLEEHGIQFDENKVIYGDFWMTSGEKLAKEYIDKQRPLPQAIVCANDYMAYGLCDTFLSEGISVPEDVTVIGYEHVGERFYHSPILTTYQRNRKAVGIKAVNTLWEKMTGEKTDDISLSGYMVLGDTCTCGTDRKCLNTELQIVRNEQFYSKLNLVGNFEQQMTVCRSIEDYVDVLQQFSYLIRDVKGVHLCLYENWCTTEISGGVSSDTETMVCYRVISEKFITSKPLFYNKYDLFPKQLIESESGDILYFCPVFFSGKELGYFILQYDKPDSYDIIFRDWIKIASNALEFLRMKNDITTLIECRNLSEYHDSITGLYNEKGLRHELDNHVNNSEKDDSVMLILVRSDLFTDNSILDKQDISVRMDIELSENLKRIVSGKNTFCAKLSSRLYAFASIGDYSEESAELLSDKLYTLISHAPLYSENCGTDSLVISSVCIPAEEFNTDKALRQLIYKINMNVSLYTDKKQHADFMTYLRVRNELYQNPQNEWSAQQISSRLNVSYGHFRSTYKELFGISFHQDSIRSRIYYAKFLLLTTSMSLSAIAYKCGYDDDKYFLRQFRQLVGITPNTYKNI